MVVVLHLSFLVRFIVRGVIHSSSSFNSIVTRHQNKDQNMGWNQKLSNVQLISTMLKMKCGFRSFVLFCQRMHFCDIKLFSNIECQMWVSCQLPAVRARNRKEQVPQRNPPKAAPRRTPRPRTRVQPRRCIDLAERYFCLPQAQAFVWGEFILVASGVG